MNTMENKVDAWIAAHREEMVQELMDWTAIPSVSRADLCDTENKAPYGPDCRRMLDYALERGKAYGFRAEDHDGYCGSLYYGDSADEIGFVAHLDVVPEGGGWIYAPYEPVVKDGFMIGRGCDDNKSSGVIGLFLMRFLKENGIKMKKTFRLMMGCAEETGMADFRHYQEAGGKVPALSIVADCGFPVCYAQKGGWNADIRIPAGRCITSFEAGNVRNAIPDYAEIVLQDVDAGKVTAALSAYEYLTIEKQENMLKVSAKGKGGHAASPEGTKDAIVLLAKAFTESGLTAEYDLCGLEFIANTFATPYGDGMGFACEDDISGKLTSNIGVIHYADGGLLTKLDVRYPVKADINAMTERFKAYLQENQVELLDLDIEKPFYIEPDDPKVLALQKIYTDVTGDVKEPYTMGGGTYSRVIPNAISFGGGLSAPKPDFLPEGHGSCHGPDEVKHIETWLKAFKIYVLSILALDQLDF